MANNGMTTSTITSRPAASTKQIACAVTSGTTGGTTPRRGSKGWQAGLVACHTGSVPRGAPDGSESRQVYHVTVWTTWRTVPTSDRVWLRSSLADVTYPSPHERPHTKVWCETGGVPRNGEDMDRQQKAQEKRERKKRQRVAQQISTFRGRVRSWMRTHIDMGREEFDGATAVLRNDDLARCCVWQN